MQGLAAKFKGKKKEEKEEEEKEKGKEAEGKGLLSEDGDEEEEEEDEEEDDDDEEEDDEDDDDAVAGPAVEGSYDAAEWDHLEVFRSTNHSANNQLNTLINQCKTLISFSTRCQRKRRSFLNTSTGILATNIWNTSRAKAST